MFKPLQSVLCVAVLAGVSLAQSITFTSPAPGTVVTANTVATVQIKQEGTPAVDDFENVALVIGVSNCPAGCADPSKELGTVLWSGLWAGGDSSISFTAPNYFDGAGEYTAALFYTNGGYSTASIAYASVPIQIQGSEG